MYVRTVCTIDKAQSTTSTCHRDPRFPIIASASLSLPNFPALTSTCPPTTLTPSRSRPATLPRLSHTLPKANHHVPAIRRRLQRLANRRRRPRSRSRRRNSAHSALQVRRLRHGCSAEARRADPLPQLRPPCAVQAANEPVRIHLFFF